MVVFVDLPDVVLLLILVKLPMWKILQLGRLCHRLNHLKSVCFNTNFKHLRLVAGSSVNKFVFDHEKADFLHFRGDFDLIIGFASQIVKSSTSSNIIFSEDWLVENVDQISRLSQLLPNITHLTVILYRTSELPNFCASLLACWPNLQSLKLLNQSPNLDFMQHTIPAISSLAHLEHLQADLGLNIEQPELAFGPLFGKLKTFITLECSKPEYIIGNNRIIPAKANRAVWNGESGQALANGLETFGLSKYKVEEPHLANRGLTCKLKYLQARLDFGANNLTKWDLTNWTALQCLHLDFHCKSLKTSFGPLLNHLTVLNNLKELHLNLYSKDFFEYLSLENSQNLPTFKSVRRFQVKCLLDPHQNLHLLENVFSNATELSLLLWTTINTSNNDRESYFVGRPHLGALCFECKETMKRAIDRYGANIASFHWFLERGQQEQGTAELVPKVKLFTTEIAGRVRPNYGFIPID